MTDIKTVLPPLPEPTVTIRGEYAAFTADQMRAYAEAAAIAASAPTKTQFNAKPLDGWVVTSQVNGDLLIESPSGDSASIFSDDLSPLGEVTRQLVQSLIFSNYIAPVDAQDAVDAKRYRWLRNESWAGYNSGKNKPEVFETVTMVLGSARNFKTILAEEALDDAVDAALQASQSPVQASDAGRQG